MLSNRLPQFTKNIFIKYLSFLSLMKYNARIYVTSINRAKNLRNKKIGYKTKETSFAFFLPFLETSRNYIQVYTDSSVWPVFIVCTILTSCARIRLLLRHLIIIVVEARTIRTGLTGETTSQRRWNGELFPHVKQNIRFTFGDRVGGCWSYRAIVKVKPLSIVNSEGSVMSSSSAKMDIPIFIVKIDILVSLYNK